MVAMVNSVDDGSKDPLGFTWAFKGHMDPSTTILGISEKAWRPGAGGLIFKCCVIV